MKIRHVQVTETSVKFLRGSWEEREEMQRRKKKRGKDLKNLRGKEKDGDREDTGIEAIEEGEV